jgi:hypothetical protein
MEPWKAIVERVQRITGTSGLACEHVRLEGAKERQHTEEHVLVDNWLLRQSAKIASSCRVRVWDGLALDARPSKVNIEEQEEDAEANNRGLCG